MCNACSKYIIVYEVMNYAISLQLKIVNIDFVMFFTTQKSTRKRYNNYEKKNLILSSITACSKF